MPELPDVEVIKGYVDATALHKKVRGISVSDRQILQHLSADRLDRVTRNHKFQATSRHGKHLFLQIDDGGWLEWHFGMSGSVKYYKHDEDAPEYAQTTFHFDNGFHLAYLSRRKLGHISVVPEPEQLIHKLKLGPDALKETRPYRTFREVIGDSRGTIKGALMAQEKLAGLGNVYTDEILFRARIHPTSEVPSLTEKNLKTLHRAMRTVLETAIERGAEIDRLPRTWLLPHRTQGDKCPRCNAALQTIKVSGRTCYCCDHCQEQIQ